jgi:hypothetical protein
MDYKNTHFPQYRKLKNGLRFYKINSNIDFEELQLVGEKVFHFHFIAEQYPEKLRIMDMLDSSSEFYDLLLDKEWETKKRLL